MGPSVTWHDPRWQRPLASCGLRAYDDLINPRSGELVWERSTTQTFRLQVHDPTSGRPMSLYLKRYVYPDRRWRFLFRRDKPAVERRNYEMIRQHVGPVVPEVIATGRRRRWGMLRDAFILTAELTDCAQLDDYARSHWGGKPSSEERTRQDRLIRTTADLVRRMHAAHFYHIDLQWRNILVRFDASHRGEAFFLDAPRGGRRRCRLRRRHGRLRDLSSLDKLARVYLTRTQRLRWFVHYTGRRRPDRADRRLIAAVLADRARYERAKARLMTSDE